MPRQPRKSRGDPGRVAQTRRGVVNKSLFTTPVEQHFPQQNIPSVYGVLFLNQTCFCLTETATQRQQDEMGLSDVTSLRPTGYPNT